MPDQLKNNSKQYLNADCKNCFGLCCIALSFAASSDFAFDKGEGTPCRNLQTDFRCGIHKHLRMNGFRGCTVYDCFGAGQKVSQVTYNGEDWREGSATAQEMFAVFPIMQQLHEILYYLYEALSLEEARPIYNDLEQAMQETERLTYLNPESLLSLYVPTHRDHVNDLLKKTSELVRARVKHNKNHRSRGKKKKMKASELIGANLRGANLRGHNLRGALLIASDLREADLRDTDLIGADLRDADLRGADLLGSIFLTQVQINAAHGDIHTNLPPSLSMPAHWLG